VGSLVDRLGDARGRRVAFLSHCLLNENVRYLGGASRSGAVAEVVEPYVASGCGLCQMPCPEQRAWGGVLKPRMLGIYGSPSFRHPVVRRVLGTLARRMTAASYRRLARRVARDIGDCVAAGIDVVEVVGVGASPSCGVATTIDFAGALRAMARCDPTTMTPAIVNRDVIAANVIEGQGLFVGALRRRLARNGLEVRFVEHDLLAELHAGAMVGDRGSQ
jgi:predicted secreted protein